MNRKPNHKNVYAINVRFRKRNINKIKIIKRAYLEMDIHSIDGCCVHVINNCKQHKNHH